MLSKVSEMEPIGVRFGRLVRDKRGVEGLSQDSLAERCDLTKARISEIERGKIANPQIKTIDSLCVALDIPRSERDGCHPVAAPDLPPHLLADLARRFGKDMPNAKEDELHAFLIAKADEFLTMRKRLTGMAEIEGRISELIRAANAALGQGDFETADSLMEEAETVHLQTNTIAALKIQAQLRIERGNSALISGDINLAAKHFERSSRYFSGVDEAIEAKNRHECATLFRYYGYRYKSPTALYAARDALQHNFNIWTRENQPENWCLTKNALGGVEMRLAQFDTPENAARHLAEAKDHYEGVRALCSDDFLPEKFATASLDLANIYSDHRLAKSKANVESSLKTALSLQLSALRFFSKSENPRSWGIIHHNLGCTYVDLSRNSIDKGKALNNVSLAIEHLQASFEVRNAEDSLQYWVASCRSIGEAYLQAATLSGGEAIEYFKKAFEILNEAAARISPEEHPHQWAELQDQLELCARWKLR